MYSHHCFPASRRTIVSGFYDPRPRLFTDIPWPFLSAVSYLYGYNDTEPSFQLNQFKSITTRNNLEQRKNSSSGVRHIYTGSQLFLLGRDASLPLQLYHESNTPLKSREAFSQDTLTMVTTRSFLLKP